MILAGNSSFVFQNWVDELLRHCMQWSSLLKKHCISCLSVKFFIWLHFSPMGLETFCRDITKAPIFWEGHKNVLYACHYKPRLVFFYPFFTAAAAYTAERPLFLDSFFPSGIASKFKFPLLHLPTRYHSRFFSNFRIKWQLNWVKNSTFMIW